MKSSRSKRRRLLQSYIVPQRPDLPATFESLNDDTLTTVLEFVGDKSYQSFAGTNKQCREVYLSSGMTKETFLYGYAPLSVIIERHYDDTSYSSPDALSKGVVFYNRRDVFDWALEELNEDELSGICNLAAGEGRIDILNKVLNNIDDENDKDYIFLDVGGHAAEYGKMKILKWIEDKGLSIYEKKCARQAAEYAQTHIIQWLQEEKGLKLDGELYSSAARGGHLHVMMWLREQEVDWDRFNFSYAATEGNLDILQWLHDEGCPWPQDDDFYCVDEEDLEPEVIEWCRVNGYGDRIIVG